MDPESDPQLDVEVPAGPVGVLTEHATAVNRLLGRYEAMGMYVLLQVAFAVLGIGERLAALTPDERSDERQRRDQPPDPAELLAHMPARDPAALLAHLPALPGLPAPEAHLPSPGEVAWGLRQARFTGSLMSWFLANERAGSAVRLVVSTMHDCSLPRAYNLVARALVAFVGLPRLTGAVLRGEVAFERLNHTARRCADLSLEQLDAMDICVAGIAAHRPMREVRQQVESQRALLVPQEAAARQAEEERCALFEIGADGTATLTLRGPVAPVTALYKRALACARGIVRGNLDAFGLVEISDEGGEAARVPAGSLRIAEERTITQTMFDLLIGMRPQTTVRAVPEAKGGRSAEGAAGEAMGTPPEAVGTQSGVAGTPHEAVGTSQLVEVTCPSDAAWLRAQAAVTVTVPVLTLAGRAALPGTLEGVHPIPAETARALAGGVDSLYRLLTDPLTGEVLDEPAQRYAVSKALRTTVQAAWGWCTGPGCSRRASNTEIDHIEPFDHADPAAGGLSTLANTQPLCKAHHEHKTRGRMQAHRDASGMIGWRMMYGLEAVTAKPHSPIDQRQAALIVEMLPAELRAQLIDDADPDSAWALGAHASGQPVPAEQAMPTGEQPDLEFLPAAVQLARRLLGLTGLEEEARIEERARAAAEEAESIPEASIDPSDSDVIDPQEPPF